MPQPKIGPNLQQPYRAPNVGRPSSYDPDFCDRVIYCGRHGYSFAMLAADLGVTRATLYAWAQEHPPFLNALLLAREGALAWWEDQGMQGLWAGKEFNDRVLKFAMTNRFPADYKERVEISTALGKIDWSSLTDEQLTRVANGENPLVVLADRRQVGPGAAAGPEQGGTLGGPGGPVDMGAELRRGADAARAFEALVDGEE